MRGSGLGRIRVGLLASAIGLAALASPAPVAATTLSSDFEASDEGWLGSQDGVTFEPVSWFGAGVIQYFDAGNNMDSDFAVLKSPPSWSGSLLDHYGGTLSFDLSTDAASPLGGPVATLLGGFDPSHAFASLPTADFQTYSVPLTPNQFIGGGTSVDLQESLAQFDGLLISADMADGSEETYLDNVSIRGGAKPPPAKLHRSLTLAYSHGAFGGLLAFNDPNCNMQFIPAGQRQKVKVFLKRKGPDKLLGSAAVLTDNSYSVAAHRKPGAYYASLPKLKAVVHTVHYSCSAAKASKTLH